MVENIIQTILILLAIFVPVIRKNNEYGNLSLTRDYTIFLRAIAIVLVVMHHVSNYFHCNYFTPLGGIGVSMFLIMSGYGLNESYKSKGLSRFWRNKIVRVLLPCWIVISIANIIKINDFSIESYMKALLCINVNWYVRYLFYWYLIFYVCTRFCERFRILIFSGIGVFMLFLPEIEAEQSFSFLVGVVISNSQHSNNKMIDMLNKYKYLIFLCGVVFFLLKQNTVIRSYEGTVIYNGIQMLVKLPLSIAAITILNKFYQKYENKLIDYIGKISYELYLTHCAMLFVLGVSQIALVNIISFYLISFFSAIVLFKIDKLINKKIK